MNDYYDGFFEIEYRRMLRMQKYLLKKINILKKQYKYYTDSSLQLGCAGLWSEALTYYIHTTYKELAQNIRLYNEINAYKSEISLKNPKNIQRAIDAGIIEAAYERAYQEQH